MAARTRAKPLYTSSDLGREYHKPHKVSEPYRSEFRHDYARLIHSSAFRRLCGKTQLFPGVESDFFRNRLTHSLEVAQVAKSIANRLNHAEPAFAEEPIDCDLVEMAGLAHDLGHPPFGHNGEHALDECMRLYGGFEGNAQSLRLLARIEKKVTDDPEFVGIDSRGRDHRFGLNLTMRTLASVLKYDRSIPERRTQADYNGPIKGYYFSERALVRKIKRAVAPGHQGKFKSLECMIMDIADDIAYSTYDLEDAFHAGFIQPLDLVAAKNELLDEIASELSENTDLRVSHKQIRAVLTFVFAGMFDNQSLRKFLRNKQQSKLIDYLEVLSHHYRGSRELGSVGYLRTGFTSECVGQFLQGVVFEADSKYPSLSKVTLNSSIRLIVETLKRFTYIALIGSPRLKVSEARGKEIVKDIFGILAGDGGHKFLPQDCQAWHARSVSKSAKMRVICDFVAGMTDRYAVEFHARLRSDTPESIFKPL
jgi:dGTPase